MTMRRTQVTARIPGVDPDEVFRTVVQFDRYPTLAPHVQATTVHQTLPETSGKSSWELHFRSGLLRWTENERFHRDRALIEFEQTDGDFELFSGHWQLNAIGADTEVFFTADFDFGIPSLEGILDPIAERVIKETVAWAIVGFFNQARLTGGMEELIVTPQARS